MIRCLSLFAGCGGLDLGLHGGFSVNGQTYSPHQIETVWANEINAAAAATFRHNFPGVHLEEGDIRSLLRKRTYPWPTDVDLVTGGFPCFIAGTLIDTVRGLVPIEEVIQGDEVLTHRLRYQSVTSIMQRENAKTISVKAIGAPTITTTLEHPFYARVKQPGTKRVWSEPKWVDAGALTKDHYIALPCDQDGIGGPDVALAYLIGRWLGDGWLVTGKRKSSIPQGHRGSRVNSQTWKVMICCSYEEVEELEKAIKATGYHATRSDERTVVKFHISSKELVQRIAEFGRGAAGKKVAAEVFTWPHKKQQALLQGWIDADAGVTISKALAIGMARIVRNVYGVVAPIHENTPPPTKVLEGRIINQRPSWLLRIPKRNVQAFVEDDFAWVPVRSIVNNEKLSTVYNISVDEDETYIANGAIVHNCQDFSLAGKGGGLRVQRGQLYQSMAKVIDRVQPSLFLAENVRGLLLWENGLAIETIKKDFAKLGYQVAYQLFDCADFGVPQHRQRVIIAGVRSDILKDFPWPQPQHFAEKDPRWITAKDAIDDLRDDRVHQRLENASFSRAKLTPGTQGNNKIKADEPAPTMRAEHHGNIEYHYSKRRRLSAREAARIQTFPDTFHFLNSTTDAYRQVGNAVPPVFGWHLARSVEQLFTEIGKENQGR